LAYQDNPLIEPNVPLGTGPPPPLVQPVATENPVWSGWDVLRIAVLTVASIFVFLLAITFAAQRLLYPNLEPGEVARLPILSVLAQLLAYVLVLGFMVLLVQKERKQRFWSAIRWNWPRNWAAYLLGGAVMAFALQALAHLLPMPKNLPIDRFFRTPTEAWVLSLFGVTFAPLLEELFFRGFLYPVLARRLGVAVAVILTALSFGLIHAPQLGRAWGPVLVVVLVGLTLTVIRAVSKSVAAGMLMHVAYNGTISVLLFVGTGGFRHLEKLSQ